jgi:ATP-dependent protease ClpP protease subunit
VAAPDCRFSLLPTQFVEAAEYSQHEGIRVQDQLVEILARDLGCTEAQARERLQSGSEISAQDALNWGLIDSISSQPLFPEG